MYRECVMPGSRELYCTSCGKCCVAMAPEASVCSNKEHLDEVTGFNLNGCRAYSPEDSTVAVILRPYKVDPRFKRYVDGQPGELRLPGGQVVHITEYAATCSEECSEKLDSSWTRDDKMPNPWKRAPKENLRA